MKYEPWNWDLGTYRVCKFNKRLYIASEDVLIYTPPDFIILNSRQQLQVLVDRANTRGQLHIKDVIVFEARAPRPKQYAQRKTFPEWEPL